MRVLRNRRWGGCVYVLQMFFSVSFVFLFFFVRQKIPDNRSPERLNGFSWNFYQTIAGKMEFASTYKMGARPPINFLGAKNYALRTWWWRLASDWEVVCWLWHCAATVVALKRHERVNAFNLVYNIKCFPAIKLRQTRSLRASYYHTLLLSACLLSCYLTMENRKLSDGVGKCCIDWVPMMFTRQRVATDSRLHNSISVGNARQDANLRSPTGASEH